VATRTVLIARHTPSLRYARTIVTLCLNLVTRPAAAAQAIPYGGGGTVHHKGKVMSAIDEFASMSDPDFLAERRRVREAIEALTERYRVINVEFDRRAGSAWKQAS
jgi:hypothetical protein